MDARMKPRFLRDAINRYRFVNNRYFVDYTYAGTPGEAWMAIMPHIRALEADDPDAGTYRFVGWEIGPANDGAPGMVRVVSGPIEDAPEMALSPQPGTDA